MDPHEVVDFASNTAYFDPVGSDQTFYPGVRDVMPGPYGRALLDWVQPLISKEYFDGAALQSRPPICKLSLVTLQPEQLRAEQKIPHVDSANENDFAFVHYFCDQSHGGTSLYRYKPTGQVKIASDHVRVLSEMAEAAKNTEDEHSGYLAGDTSLFERVGRVSAKFNRLVFYKSNLLHSADIESKKSVNKDVLSGRLSVASFLYFEAE